MCDTEAVGRRARARCARYSVRAERVAAALVDVEAGEHGGERRDRRRARVQVRRRRDLQQVLDLGRAGDERQQRRVRLREAADEHDVVVGLAEVAHDAVAAAAVGRGLVGPALADDAEAVGVVDVEQGAVLAGDARRTRGGRARCRSCCSRRPCTTRRVRVALGAQQLVEVVGILEAEALDGGAARAGDLAAVVDRLVRARVEEDRARGGEQRDHRHVDVGDRRQDERVLAPSSVGQALLDLLVEHRAAEQARPARVRAPRVEVGGDGVDDLAVEVEAEVVAGGEVGQPVVADADHAAVDLVDDGVHHRMRRLQLGEVAARLEPVLEPRTRGDARRCGLPCRCRQSSGCSRRAHVQSYSDGTSGRLSAPAGCVAGRCYLTVSVPSMPAARWPGTEQ